MVTTPVTSWGEALMTSLAAALAMFLGAIPKVIGFVVILIIGWIIAAAHRQGRCGALAGRQVQRPGPAIRASAGFVQQMGIRTDAAGASRPSPSGSCG